MSRLLVIGDVITDIVARPTGPLVTGTDTAAAITQCPGGSGANAATWAAHRGADTVLIGRVGADTGSWHAERLRESGVDPLLRVDPNRPTGTVIAVVDTDGERTMITDRGAAAVLGLDDVDLSLLDGVAHVHLSGYLLFAAPGRELALAVLGEAAKRSIPTSVDPSSSGFLAEYGPSRFLVDVAAATVLLPNRDEALLLSGASDPRAAAEALSATGQTIVLTLGADGYLVARGGRILSVGSAIATEVVDVVGAGDAFTGGFLAASLSGMDVEGCCRAGAASAAEAVGRTGGRPRSAS